MKTSLLAAASLLFFSACDKGAHVGDKCNVTGDCRKGLECIVIQEDAVCTAECGGGMSKCAEGVCKPFPSSRAGATVREYCAPADR